MHGKDAGSDPRNDGKARQPSVITHTTRQMKTKHPNKVHCPDANSHCQATQGQKGMANLFTANRFRKLPH